MIIDEWREHPSDGNAYKLVKLNGEPPFRYSLICTADFESYSAARSRIEAELSAGIEAVQNVIDNSGDKGAMHRLEDWATNAADALPDVRCTAEHSEVEVCESAFNDFDHLCTFAKEIGTLLDCEPATVVRAI